MRYSDDDDNQLFIADRIANPIPPRPDPIAVILAREFLAGRRPRILGQRKNARYDALTILFLVNALDLFTGRRLDENPIACHAASGP